MENKFLVRLQEMANNFNREKFLDLSTEIQNAEGDGYEVSHMEDSLWKQLTIREQSERNGKIYAIGGDINHLLWVRNDNFVVNGDYSVRKIDENTIQYDGANSFTATFMMHVPPHRRGYKFKESDYNFVINEARKVLAQKKNETSI